MLVGWEFGDNLNWDLVLRQTYYALPVAEMRNKHYPIPSILTLCDSQTLVIGARSDSAKFHWSYAGIVKQKLLFSPSYVSIFDSPITNSEIHRITLKELTLVRFRNYNLNPYLLEFKPAKWHTDITLEIWKYSGSEPTDDAHFNEIENSLLNIQSKIDGLNA